MPGTQAASQLAPFRGKPPGGDSVGSGNGLDGIRVVQVTPEDVTQVMIVLDVKDVVAHRPRLPQAPCPPRWHRPDRAGAFAVGNAPMPTPSATHSKTPMTKASITIKASHTSVRAGQSVAFTGQTNGLKSGTKLVLQHLRNGKWTTPSSSTTVTKAHTYALTGKLSTTGTQHPGWRRPARRTPPW